MTNDQLDQLLGDELSAKLGGAAAAPAAPGAAPAQAQAGAPAVPPYGTPRVPSQAEIKQNPFAGTELGYKGRPLMDVYKQKRGQLPWYAQAVLPADAPEILAMLSTGFMGPGMEVGKGIALPAYRVARGVGSRLLASTLAGGIGAKLEGKPFLYGAGKGGMMGGLSEGIYWGQRHIGATRAGEFLKREVPKRLSRVANKYAPWLPSFRDATEFVHSIAQPNREGTGANWIASNKFQTAIDDIDRELGRNRARAFAPRPITIKKIKTPTTFQEAVNTVDLLGQLAFDKKAMLKRGLTPNEANRARQQLIEDIENHLGHWRDPNGRPLDTIYSDAREQYGRSKGMVRFLTQPGVVAEGRIQRKPLQEAYMEMAQKGLDLDAKWKPGELDELGRELFGTGGPTATDIPGRSSRPRLGFRVGIPHAFAEPPHMPVFQGEAPGSIKNLFSRGTGPTGPYTQPQTTHLLTQRLASAEAGNVKQPPEMPPGVTQTFEGGFGPPQPTPTPPPVALGGEQQPPLASTHAVMQAVRGTKGLEDATDEEIQQYLEEYQQRQAR